MHARWGDDVQFIEVLIRQAHPGPDTPPYRTFEEKLADGRRYKDVEGLPWPLLVDDLEGTVHQAYGGLADPTYLIDVDGRVAFYDTWTHAPTLHRAIETLLRQGGRGVVGKGTDRVPHVLPAMTDGWRGIRRGLPQSFTDLEAAAPGMGTGLWLGHKARPLLAPLTLRARPLPLAVRLALAFAAGWLAGRVARRASRG